MSYRSPLFIAKVAASLLTPCGAQSLVSVVHAREPAGLINKIAPPALVVVKVYVSENLGITTPFHRADQFFAPTSLNPGDVDPPGAVAVPKSKSMRSSLRLKLGLPLSDGLLK